MQVDLSAGRMGLGRQAPSAYLMSWVAVAAFGLGYIGVAATRPDLLGVILPMADQPHEQVVAGRTAADVADELATLRKWVHDLQHELAATRNAVQEQASQNSALAQRLASAEERMVPARDVRTAQRWPNRAQAPVVVPPQQPAAAQPAEPVQRLGMANGGVDAPAPGGPGLKVINGTTSAQIATGSVPEGPVVAPAPAAQRVAAAPPAPAASPRGIEIASSESLDGLRSKWGELAGRNPDLLGELAPRYRLAADGRQAPFTLLTGPFDNPADATRACNTLRARGISCRVGAYAGNAF